MPNLLRRFLRSNSGATAIEYGVIGVLISVSIIAGAMTIGNEVTNIYSDLGSDMSKASK